MWDLSADTVCRIAALRASVICDSYIDDDRDTEKYEVAFDESPK